MVFGFWFRANDQKPPTNNEGEALKRLDRLVVGELVSPWLFGVGLFTSLLFAGTFLGRIASYLVGGTSPALVGQLVLLMVPALLVKTFSMAMLLAGLLGFGRLSSDSEIVAMKAGGASVPRIVWPVLVASLLVAGVAFGFNELVVPRAAKAAASIAGSLVRSGRVGGKADARTIFGKDGRLLASLTAKKVDLATGTMSGASMTIYDAQEREKAVLIAPTVTFQKDLGDWRIGEGARVVPLDADVNPREVVHLKGGAWPTNQAPKPPGTLEGLFLKDNDYDAYTLKELRVKIRALKADKSRDPHDVRDFEYGYWNKFSVALAALVFGVLGAALGIRHHRSGGTASGFATAVAIIFGYITLANFMNVWARGGLLPPWAGSFAPLCIGTVACGVIIYRRNL